MNEYGIFEAKAKLSEICATVAQTGQPALIRKRGIPIAKIVPVEEEESGSSVWDTVQESRNKYGSLDAEIELATRKVSKGWDRGPMDDES